MRRRRRERSSWRTRAVVGAVAKENADAAEEKGWEARPRLAAGAPERNHPAPEHAPLRARPRERVGLIAKAHGSSQAEKYYMKLKSGAAKRAASFPLLHSYVTERNVQKAETFMAELQNCGLPVDPHTFNEMMKLYVATCQYEKVLSVIDLMKRNNVPRNVLSYNLWMNAFGDISRAEWIFGSWETHCRKHDVRVSNVLLGAYMRNGWIEKAERLHLHMLEKGARPNYKTWEILTTGYVQSGQMDKATDAMKKGLSLLKNCHWRPPLELVEAIANILRSKAVPRMHIDTLRFSEGLACELAHIQIIASSIHQCCHCAAKYLAMIAKDQIIMDEEMDRLIILAGKIDITCSSTPRPVARDAEGKICFVR
ncbi:hypothetical protein HU200_009353 [Digitaria exilis]|uniref:Pentatricopeptide repeat-containing protein n=1 Tax=Digitaria exilis TaxID=1010633 RepID=A0A835FK49_9POAL|nr:hypothetical protein HU200_009353 [Digitaria exilis]